MKRRPIAVVGAMFIIAAAMPGTAHAASLTYNYGGYAGGTQVIAVGTTVSSDLTSESQVIGSGPQAQKNSVAGVNVQGLVTVGGVTTDSTGSNFGDGSKVVVHAHTAGVSLLNGLIQVSAVDTTATASGSSTSAPAANVQTTLLGLTIAGKTYPANVPANTVVGIPGVATIVLNYQASAANPDAAAAIGDGIVVTLLQPVGQIAAGAQVSINPVYASVVKATDLSRGNPVAGFAYGSYVTAHVGNLLKVESGQTAMNSLPNYGTDGNVINNSTANVNVPGAVNLGAVQTFGSGIQSVPLSDATESAKITGLNLFNGLITATAIGTSAEVRVTNGTHGVLTGSTSFVNLVIGGQTIPVNTAPNTTINVAGLGAVTINEQASAANAQGWGEKVIGLHIVLSTAQAGLPAGANIEIATSGAVVYP